VIEQRAYLADPLTFEFEAKIVQKFRRSAETFDLILDKTFFYPTGGGQPHDTGTLGEGQVIDVFLAEDGNVVHRVDQDVVGPTVTARIDWPRRLGHMQHHSAQHILSGALEQLLGLETVSVKISADSPSTADVPDVELSWSDLDQVERLANEILFENRPIKSYFISDDQIKMIPFRRPPTVTGQIRVVEVESFDYSACGGTHCPRTGMIGLVKILRTERKNKKLRLYFVAGNQALTYFQQYHDVVTDICRRLSTSPDDVVEIVQQQSVQLQSAQKEVKALQAEMLTFEAQKLTTQAEPIADGRLVTALYRNRSAGELRELAKLLQTQEKLVTLLAGFDGQKLALVVSCGRETTFSARELLAKHLAQINGRGGGDAHLAHGGGEATPAQVERFVVNTTDHL